MRENDPPMLGRLSIGGSLRVEQRSAGRAEGISRTPVPAAIDDSDSSATVRPSSLLDALKEPASSPAETTAQGRGARVPTGRQQLLLLGLQPQQQRGILQPHAKPSQLATVGREWRQLPQLPLGRPSCRGPSVLQSSRSTESAVGTSPSVSTRRNVTAEVAGMPLRRSASQGSLWWLEQEVTPATGAAVFWPVPGVSDPAVCVSVEHPAVSRGTSSSSDLWGVETLGSEIERGQEERELQRKFRQWQQRQNLLQAQEEEEVRWKVHHGGSELRQQQQLHCHQQKEEQEQKFSSPLLQQTVALPTLHCAITTLSALQASATLPLCSLPTPTSQGGQELRQAKFSSHRNAQVTPQRMKAAAVPTQSHLQQLAAGAGHEPQSHFESEELRGTCCPDMEGQLPAVACTADQLLGSPHASIQGEQQPLVSQAAMEMDGYFSVPSSILCAEVAHAPCLPPSSGTGGTLACPPNASYSALAAGTPFLTHPINLSDLQLVLENRQQQQQQQQHYQQPQYPHPYQQLQQLPPPPPFSHPMPRAPPSPLQSNSHHKPGAELPMAPTVSARSSSCPEPSRRDSATVRPVAGASRGTTGPGAVAAQHLSPPSQGLLALPQTFSPNASHTPWCEPAHMRLDELVSSAVAAASSAAHNASDHRTSVAGGGSAASGSGTPSAAPPSEVTAHLRSAPLGVNPSWRGRRAMQGAHSNPQQGGTGTLSHGDGRREAEGTHKEPRDDNRQDRRLLSNRESARRSRLKRRARTEELEEQVRSMQIENQRLHNKCKASTARAEKSELEAVLLREEVTRLQVQLASISRGQQDS